MATSCATTFTVCLDVDAEQPQRRFFIGLGPVTGQLVAHMIRGKKIFSGRNSVSDCEALSHEI
jgi:hypothetical protein